MEAQGIVKDKTVVTDVAAEKRAADAKLAKEKADAAAKLKAQADAAQAAADAKAKAQAEIKAKADAVAKAAVDAKAKVLADEAAAKAAAEAKVKADGDAKVAAAKKAADVAADAAAKKADAEQVKAAQAAAAAAAKAKTLPPPELPPAPATAAKALTASSIGALPPVDTKAPAAAAAPAPELPKLPTLKLPDPNAKEPLPSLDAITGNHRPSTMDIMQPKEAVDSKPLAPPGEASSDLPKLPLPGDSDLPMVKRELPSVNVGAAAPSKPEPVLPVVKAAPAPTLPPAPAVAVATAPAPSTTGSLETSIRFDTGKADLSEDAKKTLSTIADKVKKSNGSVRVVGYAKGSAEEASVARRLSNTRALQVRAFLLSKGLSPLTINVQALGNQVSDDKTDVFIK